MTTVAINLSDKRMWQLHVPLRRVLVSSVLLPEIFKSRHSDEDVEVLAIDGKLGVWLALIRGGVCFVLRFFVRPLAERRYSSKWTYVHSTDKRGAYL